MKVVLAEVVIVRKVSSANIRCASKFSLSTPVLEFAATVVTRSRREESQKYVFEIEILVSNNGIIYGLTSMQ